MATVRRVLNPKLIALAEKRFSPLAKEIVEAGDKSKSRVLLMEIARSFIGARESGGNNRGAEVELFQDTIGGAVREAWCMSFVQSMVGLVEHFLGLTSPLSVSEGCAQVWSDTNKIQRVKKIPAPGAVIIWGKYNSKGEYLGGHTGLVDYVDWSDGQMYAVEGNTESGIGKNAQVVRDGGGVYHTKRSTYGTGSMKVRGFIKPF